MNSTSIASIILAGILTNNMVLSKFLGICPFLGVSKKVNTAFSMSVAVTLVMVIATAVTWPIYNYLLYPNYTYLETVVFILVIAAIVQLIEVFLKKFIKIRLFFKPEIIHFPAFLPYDTRRYQQSKLGSS